MLQCNTTATNGNIERELSLKRECSLSSIYSKYIGKEYEFLIIQNIEENKEIEEAKILLFYFDKKDLESKILRFYSWEQLEKNLKIFENGGYFDGNKIRSN